jgi:predicted type IV restriction endonuclease
MVKCGFVGSALTGQPRDQQHLVLTALRSAGYRIDDADLVAMSHNVAQE